MTFRQSTGTIAFKNAMFYESFQHLYEKGDTLTIISKDLKWPEGLDGSVLSELWHYLASFSFNQSFESYEAGQEQPEPSLGKEVRTIEGGTGAERRFYDMGLRCLWLEPGRYVSFLARLEERNTTNVITAKHSYFIFDLINKKVLTQNSIFNQTCMWQDPNVRYWFYELLDYTANTRTEDSINWNLLPNQFALIGQNMRFDLDVGNGGKVYSEVSSDMVDVLFSKNFRKWRKQSLSYAGIKGLLNGAVYVSLSADSIFSEVLPQFDGNLTAAIGQDTSYIELNPTIAPVERVYASFIVDTGGSLRDIVFLTVNNIELSRGIAAALQLLRGWKPAIHNGKPVTFRYNLPLILHFQ